jgi:pimeloyl-ACP methyl ester carboxylesterase
MDAEVNGWPVRTFGRDDAEQTVLLIPGGLASHVFYEDVAAEPTLSHVRLVATTLPGYGRTKPPADDSVENYARQAGELAASLGADAVVGHSLGANVAIEMAAAGDFSGPLVLISPSFSRKDESIAPRVLDRLAIVVGHLPFALVLKLIGSMLKSGVPAHRHAALAADLQNNDPRFVQRNMHTFLSYYDRYGSLAPRLCQSGASAWVAFGENDDVKLQPSERDELEACPHVALEIIQGTGHMSLVTHPERIADLILEALASATSPERQGRI